MVRALSTYLILLCSFAVNAQETVEFTVRKVNVSINGEIYAPVFKDSSLIVCGTRKDRIVHTHLDKDGQEPIDLYVLDLDSGYTFSRFDKKFRSDFHDGPIAFNHEEDRCVVSRNLRLDQRFKSVQDKDNHLGLFESRFVYGEWTDLVPLKINSDQYNCTHPALSADGQTLVFASNMPGGQGGYDLWKIEKLEGIWGEPQNLGTGVNTSGNEFFPTWIGNTLYFSSNRKAFGGLDIYQVDGWSEQATTNLLEAPLNSENDDFGLISRDHGRSGYFSSNRSGSDQLWAFDREIPEFEGCDSLVNDDFCYTLFEETAYELGGIDALVYEWDINGVKKYGYEIDYCFPGVGEYVINVDIIDTMINQTYANQASYTLELTNEEQPYITSPDSVRIGEAFSLNPDKTFLPGVEIASYYWMLSDGTLFTTKNPTHAFEEEGEFKVTLGVVGTKDGQPFKDCSYKYMVATRESITDTILSEVKPMKAFEEEGQIVESTTPLVTTDSSLVVHSIEIAKSSMKLPDSSEVLAPAAEKYIINTLFNPKDSTYVYVVGEWLNMGEAHATWRDIVELGYKDATVFTYEKESISGLPLNKSFTLENIWFDNNKSTIREDAKEPLQILVLLLKEFEHVRLSIAAHTDDVGREIDNLLLSEERGKAISDYLIETGVDKDRIESKGFGESQPKYTNETAEGRAKNRRVEFKLITTQKVETLND